MQALIAVLKVVAPVFAVAGVGFALAKLRRGGLGLLNDALFYVLVPALIFTSMAESELSAGELADIAEVACAVALGCGALGWGYQRLRGTSMPGLLLVSMFPNNGNMGIPLCALAFGAEGLALGTAYYAATAMLSFSLGLFIASGGTRPLEMFRVPLVYAACAGLAVKVWELPVAVPLGDVITWVGRAAIPGMLLSLGHRLAHTQVRGLGPAAVAVLLRMGGGLLIGWALTWLLQMDGSARAVMILQASMPAAVMNAVMAEKYQQQPELVASAVAISTLVSVVTIPVLLAQLM